MQAVKTLESHPLRRPYGILPQNLLVQLLNAMALFADSYHFVKVLELHLLTTPSTSSYGGNRYVENHLLAILSFLSLKLKLFDILGILIAHFTALISRKRLADALLCTSPSSGISSLVQPMGAIPTNTFFCQTYTTL